MSISGRITISALALDRFQRFRGRAGAGYTEQNDNSCHFWEWGRGTGSSGGQSSQMPAASSRGSGGLSSLAISKLGLAWKVLDINKQEFQGWMEA